VEFDLKKNIPDQIHTNDTRTAGLFHEPVQDVADRDEQHEQEARVKDAADHFQKKAFWVFNIRNK